MENLKKTTSFQTSINNTEKGIISTLVADVEISAKKNISFEGKSLLANYVYKKDGTYNLIYTIIDAQGNEESYAENDGILPTLFCSPAGRAYTSIMPYHPDKEQEISIPVFEREGTEQPKGNRPFTGDFIGTSNQHSIFYDVDIWSDKKPDKLLAIEFKDDVIKKKHNIKVPLPRNNKIFISDNEIHLLSSEGAYWLHRLIDEQGNVIRERKINAHQEYFWEILSLSFEKESHILCEDNGKIFVETISTDGNCETIQLIDIQDVFYNTWQPERIAENTFVTQFNNEFGNGWFITEGNRLVDFYYSKGVKGYKNLLTGGVLEMDFDNLVISGINKTTEYGYAVVFYPQTDGKAKNNKLIVLNRRIK